MPSELRTSRLSPHKYYELWNWKIKTERIGWRYVRL